MRSTSTCVGDTMRGSQVLGAAIVDSHNRWITIHGTEYLVVRDCVGYRSVGHGYFMEDGTEVYNLLDRNLGVQAYQRQAAAQAGAAVRSQRRRRLLVGQRPQHARPQRRLRERRVRLPLRHAALEVLQQHAAGDDARRQGAARSTSARFRSGASRTTNRTPKGCTAWSSPANGNSQPDTPIRDQKMLDTIKPIDWTGPDTRHPHIIREPEDLGSPLRLPPAQPVDADGGRAHPPRGLRHLSARRSTTRCSATCTCRDAGGEPFNRGMDDASCQAGRSRSTA